MSLHVWALQVAIVDALAAAPELTAMLGDPPRIWDEPPADKAYPYVTLGRSQTRSIDAAAAPAESHEIILHIWSRYGGRREAREISGLIKSVLDDAPLTLSGARLVSLYALYSDVFRTNDGRTTHGIVRLRAVTEPDGV